jgi:mannonate dehydratase
VNIEDTWHACYNSSYWRNGPVLNNALSGIDMALWDILGKLSGLPVYRLLGGKCRPAADCYAHASGAEISEVVDNAQRLIEQGFRHVRVQVGVPGMAGYGARRNTAQVERLHQDPVFEPAAYLRRAHELFRECRRRLGEEVELLHDVHERIPPTSALRFVKDVEPYRLFFLEDPLSPEDIDWFPLLRQHSTTPIAMGELFNSPHEWTRLISGRLIDFIRIHLSQAGGVTPCRKIAALAELFGVRTAWHGPGDVSPIGHAANLALDLACWNFGIQESYRFPERVKEVFRGCPKIENGYLYPTDKPGWGIEIDEEAAARYPFGSFEQGSRKDLNGGWGIIRRRDGTVIKQ